MKKRILFLALTVAAMVAVFALTASAATSGYYAYSVSNSEAMITDVDTSISGDVTIPSTLGGYPVTSIGEYAFMSCDRLTSVTIPEGVTSIGQAAFLRCYKLTSATIPKGVTSIGSSAFSYCDNLTSVTIPEGVMSIEDYAFNCCYKLTSVTIPEGVTSIGEHAFAYCSSLTSMAIPSSVTSIGAHAFSACDSLTSFTVDSQNTYYSHDAYGVLFDKNKTKLIQYPIGNTRTSYTIPSSVTSIGDNAFDDCASLTSVTIPEGVTSIGYIAFRNCSSLTSMTIPSSVTSIGTYAFQYCSSITSITVDSENADYTGEDGVLFNKAKTILIQYPAGNTRSSYTIPSSVTSIGSYGFHWCFNLTSVTIPSSVTSIGSDAFYQCRSLTSMTIPEGVTSIGGGAFERCSSLTSVTIPSSVTSIGGDAFEYCNSLTIYGYRGTTAETYASNNSIPFIDLATAVAPPVIVLQPVSAAYVVGDTAIPLTVAATGNTISYQWYEAASLTNSDGTAIPGATLPTYTPSTATVGIRYYYAVVINSNPDLPAGTEKTLASDPVAVTVEKRTKFTLSGRVLSYGSVTDALTVELLDGSSVAYSTTVTGSDVVFTLTDVLDGTYDLRIRKALHLDYTIKGITVTGADIDLTVHADPNIACITLSAGDLNGDGVINIADVALLRLADNYGKTAGDFVFSFGG